MRRLRLVKEVAGVPVGMTGVVEKEGESSVRVRWIWPAGAYLKDKPDIDSFTYRELEEYFRMEV